MGKALNRTEKERFFNKEVCTVAILAVVGLLAQFILAALFFGLSKGGGNGFREFWEWLAQAGDVPHYIRIAEHGYSVGDEFENLIVFYPLFPMLMKVVGFVVRDHMAAGIVISNVCSVFSACFLYKLVRMDHSKEAAGLSVLFLMLYPFAFFMSFCYTEALFVMLCLMCAYFCRRGTWWAAGITGMLAALCRTQGVIMFGVAVYEILVQTRARAKKTEKKGFFRSLPVSGLFTLLIPCGYGVYLLINKLLFGDWFKFMEFQKAAPWYHSVHFYVENLQEHLRLAASYYPQLAFVIYIPQVIMFIVAFVLIFVGVRHKVRTSYLLHIAAYTAITYFTGWLISGGRYMLACVFMFIPMALLAEKSKAWKYAMTTLLAALHLFTLYLYVKGYAIM